MTAKVLWLNEVKFRPRFKKSLDLQKNALYLRVNVFSAKVLIGNTIFTSPTVAGTRHLQGKSSTFISQLF